MSSPVIYFISPGTSSNDLNGKTTENNLLYSGFKQLINLRKNDYFKKYILNDTNTDFLVSANRSCVESSLILFSDINKHTITVANFLNKIKNKNTNYIDLFKRNIAKNKHSIHYLETLNYGKNYDLTSLIHNLPNIDYGTLDTKNYSFNSSKFISYLEQKLLTTTKNTVIVCESSVIREILKKMSSTEYRQIKYNFENSSIWEIKYIVKNNKINYDMFFKIYPTPKEFKPLIFKDGKYLYDFKGKDIPLFEKKSDVSSKILEIINTKVYKVKKNEKDKNNEKYKNIKNNKKNENNIDRIISSSKSNNISYDKRNNSLKLLIDNYK
jgi:hypothetical protein